MARISKKLSKEREDLVYLTFFNDPKASIKDVNGMLERDYGFAMNLSRIYALRNSAVADAGAKAKKENLE